MGASRPGSNLTQGNTRDWSKLPADTNDKLALVSDQTDGQHVAASMQPQKLINLLSGTAPVDNGMWRAGEAPVPHKTGTETGTSARSVYGLPTTSDAAKTLQGSLGSIYTPPPRQALPTMRDYTPIIPDRSPVLPVAAEDIRVRIPEIDTWGKTQPPVSYIPERNTPQPAIQYPSRPDERPTKWTPAPPPQTSYIPKTDYIPNKPSPNQWKPHKPTTLIPKTDYKPNQMEPHKPVVSPFKAAPQTRTVPKTDYIPRRTPASTPSQSNMDSIWSGPIGQMYRDKGLFRTQREMEDYFAKNNHTVHASARI